MVRTRHGPWNGDTTSPLSLSLSLSLSVSVAALARAQPRVQKERRLFAHRDALLFALSNFLQLPPCSPTTASAPSRSKIVEFEIKRHELRVQEEQSLDPARAATSSSVKKTAKQRSKKRMKKQDQLVFVRFSVLLNLVEAIHTEQVRRVALLAKVLYDGERELHQELTKATTVLGNCVL
jgi:hypothetical protein